MVSHLAEKSSTDPCSSCPPRRPGRVSLAHSFVLYEHSLPRSAYRSDLPSLFPLTWLALDKSGYFALIAIPNALQMLRSSNGHSSFRNSFMTFRRPTSRFLLLSSCTHSNCTRSSWPCSPLSSLHLVDFWPAPSRELMKLR